MTPKRVALQDIAGWAGGRELFWVYEHVMAACSGAILMVPVHLVEGSLKALCARCPVPFETALDVMDQTRLLAYHDVLAVELAPIASWAHVQEMAGEGAWFAAAIPQLKSRVYLHEHGIRLAVADEFVIAETKSSSHAESSLP